MKLQEQDHELDFILLPTRNASPVVLECKWRAGGFDPVNLKKFRHYYPGGSNFVVASDVDRVFQRHYDEILVTFIGLPQLIEVLNS